MPARVLGGDQACHCVVQGRGLALTSDFPRKLLLHGAPDADQICEPSFMRVSACTPQGPEVCKTEGARSLRVRILRPKKALAHCLSHVSVFVSFGFLSDAHFTDVEAEAL